jgi:ubiquinone/menaquinone biosynthesis C-methylase UbiE
MCDLARTRSRARVIESTVEEVTLPPASFDVVCGWHVLEHVPEPVLVLSGLRRLLAEHGLLFLEVPNVHSSRAMHAGDSWSNLDPEHHLGHFAPATLALALRRARYGLVTLETVPAGRYRPFPRSILSYGREAIAVRGWPFGPHPSRHELLRAVARPLGADLARP